MTHLGEMEEDLDEGVVADHMRATELSNFEDRNYLQFSNVDKNMDPNWVNILIQRKVSAEDSSPHAASHLSPEPGSISELTSFEYSQRLPSLESSSSVPIGRCTTGLASHPFLAWQPFGGTSVHHHVSSSLHTPALLSTNNNNSAHTPNSSSNNSLTGPGHLFPVSQVANSTPTGSTTYGPLGGAAGEYANSPPSEAFLRMRAAAAAASVSTNTSSPLGGYPQTLLMQSGESGQDVLQPLRMVLATTNPGALSPSGGATPVPSYATGPGSFTSTSIGQQQQQPTFLFNPSTGSSTPTSSAAFYDDPPLSKATSNIKQRSKKESHNRIERKRRDFINAQIVYLSSLLPPELYRDVDGRRNKGSVLRLSVNYIMELREAVAWMNNVKQENAVARELIPLLIRRIEALERTLVDQGAGDQVKNLRQVMAASSPPISGTSSSASRSPVSLESLYQSWLMLKDTNQRINGAPGTVPSFCGGAGGAGSSTTSASSSGSNSINGQQQQQQQQQQHRQQTPGPSSSTPTIPRVSSGHLTSEAITSSSAGVCYQDAGLLMMANSGGPGGDTTDGHMRPDSAGLSGNPLLLMKREQVDMVDRINQQQQQQQLPHHHQHHHHQQQQQQQRSRRLGSTLMAGDHEEVMVNTSVGGLIAMDDVGRAMSGAVYDGRSMQSSANFESYDRMMQQAPCQPSVYGQNN